MTGVGRDSGAAPLERSVSIGTWNMDYWRRTVQSRQDAWKYLRTSSKADIMLLQESVAPVNLPRTRFVYREIAGNRPWGSSVVAFAGDVEMEEIDAVRTVYGAKKFSMLGSLPGSVIVARANLPEVGPITCVSVYCVMNDMYSQTRMFRVVADLIPLFDSRDGARVVLGGDFNLSTAVHPNTPELPRYRAVLAAVESLGLINLAATAADCPDPMPSCPCGADDCCHVRTYGNDPGRQLDWLFATPELARRCARLRVDHTVLGTLSDHAPLIAEFQVPALGANQVVDRDSFLKELGIRAGPQSALIAEELVEWALHKHAEMDRLGRRAPTLDRLPAEPRNPPELWFQLDRLSSRDARNLLQWTFSIKADGRVVVQFKYMSSPFDTEEAREELRSKINRIAGVTLEKKLKGQPSFPLISLEKSERRQQFQCVFSDMIDETVRVRTASN